MLRRWSSDRQWLQTDLLEDGSELEPCFTNRIEGDVAKSVHLPPIQANPPGLPSYVAVGSGVALEVREAMGGVEAVTILPASGETILGQGSFVISGGRWFVRLVSDGVSDWYIEAQHP